MARVAALMVSLGASQAAPVLPDAFLGTWTPIGNHTAVAAILGPVEVPTFTMAHDKKKGDYWMSVITGQVFRIRTDESGQDVMQYCFASLATSPFVVDTNEDNFIRFCYKTGDRMESHKVLEDGSLATGCDAAQINLELHDNGQLELTFYMSPPVRHAWALYERTGDSPPIGSYILANAGGKCDPLNPLPPTLGGSPCPVINYKKQQLKNAQPAALPEREGPVCRQYNHGGLRPSDSDPNRMDVKLQYAVPEDSCWPCNVTYAVSAAIAEDEYVGFGFKGIGYRKELLPGPDGAVTWNVTRSSYFGMSKDDFDRTRTQADIVLGYAGGSTGDCIREMKSEQYVGAPTDVAGSPNLFDASVERVNGRTVMHFTVEQHVGQTDEEIAHFFNAEQLSQRTMWAIGPMAGAGCEAEVQFHHARGLSPLAWFGMNPKIQCDSADGFRVEHNTVSV